jgi:cholesterol oxidase
MTNLFAIGQDNAGGRLLLRRGKLDIVWDYEAENRELIGRQRAAMEDTARSYGGTFADFPLWGLFRRTMTVHSLGGCRLSTHPDEGVVDVDGQVHGHPGLFVADGSVIPTAIGSHPVMTISAIAERIAETVVESFG